jgi:hypothetical protein
MDLYTRTTIWSNTGRGWVQQGLGCMPEAYNHAINIQTLLYVSFSFFSSSRVALGPFRTSVTIWPIVPVRIMDDDDCGAVSEMGNIGNLSTRRKPASVQFCPPQTWHDLTRDRTRAAAVGSQRLTAWPMARSLLWVSLTVLFCLH